MVPFEVRRRIGFAPDAPSFPRHLTGLQVLELHAALLGMPSSKGKARAREVVDLLEHRGESRRHQFSRRWVPQAVDIAPVTAALSLSLGELLAAVDRVLRTTKEPTVHDVVPRALDVAGAMGTIRTLLAMRRDARWSDLVGRDAEPWQILSVLLALLELAKLGEVRIAQLRPFATVEIRRDAISEAA